MQLQEAIIKADLSTKQPGEKVDAVWQRLRDIVKASELAAKQKQKASGEVRISSTVIRRRRP